MYIHLKSKGGLFKVSSYGNETIVLDYRRKNFIVDYSDYKCMAGGIWNVGINKNVIDSFLKEVSKKKYRTVGDRCNDVPDYVYNSLQECRDIRGRIAYV
jgi:hypothetical protein